MNKMKWVLMDETRRADSFGMSFFKTKAEANKVLMKYPLAERQNDLVWVERYYSEEVD